MKNYLKKLKRMIFPKIFPGTIDYWEKRYSEGGNSGSGSYNQLAIYKAEIINQFVIKNQIHDIIEFGCGDGNQLSLAQYPKYIGFDVSKTAIKLCVNKFLNDYAKSFFLYDSFSFVDNHNIFKAELALSLDVIFHLIEDEIFETYLTHLFNSSTKYVIIYASNFERNQTFHEKHRIFTNWIKENITGWEMVEKTENKYKYDPKDPGNTSNSDFYFFHKIN